MKIYLDNCCFNRPFDDQRQIRVRLEAEAKLFVQDMIRNGEPQLVWSYILDYENAANPFEERRRVIGAWKRNSAFDVVESPEILDRTATLTNIGIKPKDALHVSCAISAGCEFFLTTDDLLIRKGPELSDIRVIDPPTFVREVNL